MIHMHTLELQDKDDKIKIKIITLKKVHTNIHSEFTPDKNQPHRCLELLDKKYQIVRSYFSFFYSMFNMLCMGSWGPLGLLVFVLWQGVKKRAGIAHSRNSLDFSSFSGLSFFSLLSLDFSSSSGKNAEESVKCWMLHALRKQRAKSIFSCF